jgi:hypothetical protein
VVDPASALPSKDLKYTGPLTAEQLGHLRHYDNLSRQLPNDWSHMQGRAMGQMDFGGYRFQLAYMAYALGLTHFHRLPNAPGVFKPVFERLMEKLLLPETWLYWRDVSRGGSVYNQHLSADLREEWDPVARDNIMYSAYVQSMALMFNYLFDDDRYTRPGSLAFKHWSFFWGGELKEFDYDQNSLNEHIYWQMVESGYLGVACEPNCIFQICNQPAILGFRLHDVLNGGDTAAEVTRSYEQAWARLGRTDEKGHYVAMVAQDTGVVRPSSDDVQPWVDAWLGTLMNMWNRDYVHEHYPRQIKDIIKKEDGGTIDIVAPAPREVMGQPLEYDWANLGWASTWASEMGDEETLTGLLAHADEYMNPTWEKGGLYYPRNDTEWDAEGHSTLTDPVTGNVLIGYARLNVPDGLWSFYNRPWTREHFDEPLLTEVADGVVVSQAYFARDRGVLVFTAALADGTGQPALVRISNVVERGSWSLSTEGRVVADSAGAPTPGVTVSPTGHLDITIDSPHDVLFEVKVAKR